MTRSGSSHEVRVHENAESLAASVAKGVGSIAEQAIAARGRFTWVLSGGSTPRRLFEFFSTHQDLIDWKHVEVFWGDERCVGPEDPQSNFRMAREALLDTVPIPDEQIHRLEAERDDTATVAADYEQRILHALGGAPGFDLVLLGMGDDGHTASLFPDTAALDEQRSWVVANDVPQLETQRLTLTAPALNSAANIYFLVCGASKAYALKQVLEGPYSPHCYPSQLIQPTGGKLVWHVDSAAIEQLTRTKFLENSH